MQQGDIDYFDRAILFLLIFLTLPDKKKTAKVDTNLSLRVKGHDVT